MENPNKKILIFGKSYTNKEYVQKECRAMVRAYKTLLDELKWTVDVTPDTQSADCCVYQLNFGIASYMRTSGCSVDAMWHYLSGLSTMYHYLTDRTK